jgi:hypothetical protein
MDGIKVLSEEVIISRGISYAAAASIAARTFCIIPPEVPEKVIGTSSILAISVLTSPLYKSHRETMMMTYNVKIESQFIKAIIKSFDIDTFIKLIGKENHANTNLIVLHYYRLKTNEDPDDLNHYFELKGFFLQNIR